MSLLITPILVTPLLKVPLILTHVVMTHYATNPPNPPAKAPERQKYAKDTLTNAWLDWGTTFVAARVRTSHRVVPSDMF